MAKVFPWIALTGAWVLSVAVGGSIYEPYTYRVCAVNSSGRACSDAVQVPRAP